MARYQVLDTWWDGPRLQILARPLGDEWGDAGRHQGVGPGTATPVAGTAQAVPLPWQGPFHWHVGEQVADAPDPPPCVFEPLGLRDPTHHCPLCDREHVVYAAFHGLLVKVGLTSAARLETRLREQGADAGFVIARCPDRSEARRVERSIARLYGVSEFRRHAEALRAMTQPLDWSRIEARAQDLRARVAGAFDPEPDLVRIEDVPLPLPLPAPPLAAAAPGPHAGRWLGAKGNFLVYEAAAGPLGVGGRPVVALRRQDLVGRTIDAAGP